MENIAGFRSSESKFLLLLHKRSLTLNKNIFFLVKFSIFCIVTRHLVLRLPVFAYFKSLIVLK